MTPRPSASYVAIPDDVIELIDGASGDWGTSPDAMRWTPDPASQHGFDLDALHRAVATFVDALTDAYRRVGEELMKMAPAFERAGLLPKPAPKDPMQRALEARRTRHTGPRPPRMDGRR